LNTSNYDGTTSRLLLLANFGEVGEEGWHSAAAAIFGFDGSISIRRNPIPRRHWEFDPLFGPGIESIDLVDLMFAGPDQIGRMSLRSKRRGL
jgi:hypothetical protein